MDPVTAMLVVGGVAEGVGAIESTSGAELEEQELGIKQQQQTIQYQQKSLQNYDTLEKVTDAQLAQATVKGVSLNSPSFNAIQRDTFNTFSKEQKNLDLEKSFGDESIKIEKANVKDTLFASLFGGASRTALSFATLMNKKPSGG